MMEEKWLKQRIRDGETILVVEDEQAVRKVLVDSLKSLNYHGLPATNGKEALRIGLVNGVYDDENYLNAARHKALAITRLPREAVLSAKALIRSHTNEKVMQAIENEGAEFIERLHSPEAREKLAAILKR